MRLTPIATPTITGPRNGGSISLRPILGQGVQGLPGPGAAAWTAATVVTTGSVRQAPDGSWIKSVGNRTTRGSFDATEATFWTAVLGTAGTVEATSLSAAYARPQVMLAGAGIDYTGVTASTTAIQAKIDAAPQGADILAQAGILKFSTLTIDGGKRLVGTGWQFYRDATVGFGDAAYLDDQWFGGTVLRSTASSGSAITLVDTFVTGGALKGFILVGPGSGTAVGVDIGDATHSVIDPDVDLYVCNFALGVKTRNVNEGTLKIRTRGCTKGASFEVSSNNIKVDMNAQVGVDGFSTDSTTLALTFTSTITQALTGTGGIIEGTAHAVINPYGESLAGVRTYDFVSGDRHVLITPSLNTSADTVRVQAACDNVRIIGMDPARLTDASTTTIVDTPRPWTDVTGGVGFQNSYADSAPFVTRFRRSTDGQHVEIAGQITGGASGVTAFTLPAECRPFTIKWIPVPNLSSGAILMAAVAPTGAVTVYGGIAGDIRAIDMTVPLDV